LISSATGESGGLVIDEGAHPGALEEGDAPAIAVMVGQPATGGKAGEAEDDVGGGVAVHPEKLAHDVLR
jgi:hypothetical protein